MLTILSFIVVIGIIIFVHELGHFLAAKLSGVRVEIFSLGFPPKMISKKVGETEYQIAWIPLGGFVKMTGMLDESLDDDFDPEDSKAFINKPFINRVFIITAGVIMNFALGYLIYLIVIMTMGMGTIEGTQINMVSPGSPAEIAGIIQGDKIVEIDGTPINQWDELTGIVRQHPGDSIVVNWLRGDSLYSATIVPISVPAINAETGDRDSVGQLGVLGTIVRQPVSFIAAFVYAGQNVWMDIDRSITTVTWLVTGQAGIKDLSGPLGIAKMSGDSARSGFVSFIIFIAFISVSIGFLNILPIPALDGGHLLFMVIEGIIRRPIPVKVKSIVIWGGLASLLLLMITVSYYDVIRVFFSN